jgi:hypothetical protein
MATVAHWTEAQPKQPESRPLAGPCRRVRVQHTRHGAALTSVLLAYQRRGVDLHLLQLIGYKPLHRDLRERGQRGGLTGEAVGLMVANGVKGET